MTNPFGHFGKDGGAFTITDPRTPSPWVNVISNGRYGLVVSQNGGGFAFLDNSQLNVISRWDMDLIRDHSGRFLYLHDLDSRDTWSLAPNPCRPDYDHYACTHEPGVTTFETRLHEIDARWTIAVDPEDPVEVWAVHLTNTSSRKRRFRIASHFEWCCGVAPDVKREFHRLFITTEHDPQRRAILATKNMWDVPARTPADHWNRPWPYVAAHAVAGDDIKTAHATGDKAAFLGPAADSAKPSWLSADVPSSRFGRFADACASLAADTTLEPGASTTIYFITTIAESRDELESLLDRHRDPKCAATTADDARAAWSDRLAPASIKTDLPGLDLLSNTWLPYQAISARLWARTGYYQQSGAFGFRDQLQDSQVFLPLEPQRTREQILLHAAHQFADGRVYHWWHPLAEFGLETQCSDDYLWLPFVAAAYVRETGDIAIFDEAIAFIDSDTPATLLEHCRLAIERTLSRLSPRGLPLIGSCDWNDGLSAVGIEERGESVWLAFFLAEVLADFAQLLELTGDITEAESRRAQRTTLLNAANTQAWDGAWFRRATTDDGTWLGSSDSPEGKIYLNPQTWAVLTDAAPEDRLADAWRSVREHLIKDMGPLLLAPAYTKPDPAIGYITRYSPGSRENGGVYTHAAVWALAAAAKRRDVDALSRIVTAIAPTLASERDPAGYAAEPYATPGNIDGPLSDTPGRAGWTWYTGSAAWLHRVCLERILGIRPTWTGLVIDPCPLPEMGEVKATRRWRGRIIKLSFSAAEYAPEATPVLTLDGVPLSEPIITEDTAPSGATLDLRITWKLPVTTRPTEPTAVERSLP